MPHIEGLMWGLPTDKINLWGGVRPPFMVRQAYRERLNFNGLWVFRPPTDQFKWLRANGFRVRATDKKPGRY